jgi:hypothetical protein
MFEMSPTEVEILFLLAIENFVSFVSRPSAFAHLTENLEEFLILDSLLFFSSDVSQPSSCERARSTFSSSKHGE